MGTVGHLHLNRPTAINALTMDMLAAVQEALQAWRADPTITAVVIDGAGDRGFCAGGDIKAVHRSALEGGAEVEALWRLEYAVDHDIATFPAPVVAVMHGVTMGGGIGLAGHASHRLVTPDARLAMPEVRIGMAPDVGGCLLLGRAPGRLGEHLALTGSDLRGADAVHVGLADMLVERLDGAGLAKEIDASGLEETLAARSLPLPSPAWTVDREWIDSCYAGDTVPDILARLSGRDSAAAQDARTTLLELPPRALAVTLEALRRARELGDLAAVLRQDLRVMTRFVGTGDLLEGIRSRVIDRTVPPAWEPGSFEDLTAQDVERHFAPLHSDLTL